MPRNSGARRPRRPGGYFQHDDFCVGLSAVCETYGDWHSGPAARMGWDEPGNEVFCLAFDASVLYRARRCEADRLDAMRADDGKPKDGQALADRRAKDRKTLRGFLDQLPADSEWRAQLEREADAG